MSFIPKPSNTQRRAKIIQDIVHENYEQGVQSKSMRRIFREKIYKQFPMSYRTFLRYMKCESID